MDRLLAYIKQELEQHLKARLNNFTGKGSVELMPVQEAIESSRNSVAISLINIEEERTNSLNRAKDHRGQHVEFLTDVIKLNLYLLVSANFSDYKLSLKHLSTCIDYFNTHQQWTAESHPGLPDNAQNVNFRLINYGLNDLKDLWSFLGGSYRPSVVYRVQGLILGGQPTGEIIPAVDRLKQLFGVKS